MSSYLLSHNFHSVNIKHGNGIISVLLLMGIEHLKKILIFFFTFFNVYVVNFVYIIMII